MERVGKRTCMDIGPSVLNLRRWIFQKDVIRLILKRLNKADWELVWAAHNKRYEQQLLADASGCFLKECMKQGYLNLLLTWKKIDLKDISWYLKYAAQGGHLYIVQWSVNNSIDFDPLTFMFEAVVYGHVHIMKWLLDNVTSCSLTDEYYFYALQGGHINVMEFLKQHDVPVPDEDHYVTVAAQHGQLNTLKWLLENGHAMNKDIITEAVKNNHLETLKWVIKNGCPCDWEDLDIISDSNYISLDMKKWIKKQRNKQLNI